MKSAVSTLDDILKSNSFEEFASYLANMPSEYRISLINEIKERINALNPSSMKNTSLYSNNEQSLDLFTVFTSFSIVPILSNLILFSYAQKGQISWAEALYITPIVCSIGPLITLLKLYFSSNGITSERETYLLEKTRYELLEKVLSNNYRSSEDLRKIYDALQCIPSTSSGIIKSYKRIAKDVTTCIEKKGVLSVDDSIRRLYNEFLSYR